MPFFGKTIDLSKLILRRGLVANESRQTVQIVISEIEIDIRIEDVGQPNILVSLPVINETAANTDPSYSSRLTSMFVSFLN